VSCTVQHGEEPPATDPAFRWCVVVRSADPILFDTVRDNLRPGSQYFGQTLVGEVVCVRVVGDVYCTIWCKALPAVL
jgi:hypothetical protein